MAAVPSIGRASQVEPGIHAPEADATRDLYERYAGQIMGFCVHQLGSREEAEDAVQVTFMNAFRAIQRGVEPESESAWLFKIAHNVCLSRRRSSWRRGRVETASDLDAVQDILAAPQHDGGDDLIQLTDALAHMPDNQRRAILLREWQGLSYHEIADQLEISQSAVETLIFRARRTLATNLERQREAVGRAKKRGRAALDLGSALFAMKSLFAAGTAVKAAAAVIAVSGTAVVATSPPQPTAKSADRMTRVAITAPAFSGEKSAPARLASARFGERLERVVETRAAGAAGRPKVGRPATDGSEGGTSAADDSAPATDPKAEAPAPVEPAATEKPKAEAPKRGADPAVKDARPAPTKSKGHEPRPTQQRPEQAKADKPKPEQAKGNADPGPPAQPAGSANGQGAENGGGKPEEKKAEAPAPPAAASSPPAAGPKEKQKTK